MTSDEALKIKDNWKFKGLTIRRGWVARGNEPLTGSIQFENPDVGSFDFVLSEEQVNSFVLLVASHIVKTAEDLGDTLIASLRPLVVDYREQKQLEARK